MMSPVFIIGAPRSGTNMLRDMLTSIEGVDTWPCDEINYIWKHGNVRVSTDELLKEHATPKVKKYIRREFDKISSATGSNCIVEKTCANSLRVGFVNEIFPEARYIFIVRDGMDAVGSAKERWRASLDIPYLMKKVRYVPLVDLPYYFSRYMLNRLYKLISGEKRLASWGPTMAGMKDVVQNKGLLEACAFQWRACVERSASDFKNIDDSRICVVKYEEFVSSPSKEFERVAKFMGANVSSESVKEICSSVSSSSVGKGRANIDGEEAERVKSIMKDTLMKYGYPV